MQTKKEKTTIRRIPCVHKPLLAAAAAVVQCLDDPCFAVDSRGAVAAWNQAMESLTGVSAEAMLGRADREYALPFFGRKTPLLVDYALTPGLLENEHAPDVRREADVLVREELFPALQGGRVLRTRASVLRDPQGVVVGAVQSFRDIPDPGLARQVRAADEEKYRVFFENSNDFFYIHDFDGHLIETNMASKMYTGYTAEEIIRMNIKDLVPGQYRPMFDKYLEEILIKGGSEGLISVLTKDGRERVIEYRNTLVRDAVGNPLYVQGTGRDITDKIKGQRALKISEDRYRTILESIEEPYFEVDLSGNFTFFNQALAKNLKFASDEIKGLNYRQYMDEENARKVFETFHRVYITGKAAKTLDWEVRDKYGGRRYAEASVSLIRDAKGNPTGFRGIVRDITQRKEAERERDRYELRLSQAQRMEAIGTLASGIAHDFNNMLSAIMGYTELARRQLQNEESQAVRNLEQVLKAGMRARDLVAQLLSIGRNYKAERETVKVIAVVREALNLLRATLPTTIEIRTALHPEAGTVYADPTEIHQLIMNLCTNAYQAMEEKGGLLLITLEPVIINGSENAANIQPPISEGAYVKLVVSDTGCGMDEDVIRHIFDPFFTTKERGKGTGLGLATVSRIVADLKGGVAVKSNPGEGAEFTLYLPRYDFKAKNPKKR